MSFDILFVCTGNICRSPTAHLLAASRLPADRFTVHSAGTYGLAGYPVEPSAARLLTAQGIGCDEFRARRLDPDLVARADLILTATREHRTAVVTIAPEALPKTFPIWEFARLVAQVDGIEDPHQLVAAAAAARGRAWAPPEQDDVADPYGLGGKAYDRAFQEIATALDRPLNLLAGTTLGA